MQTIKKAFLTAIFLVSTLNIYALELEKAVPSAPAQALSEKVTHPKKKPTAKTKKASSTVKNKSKKRTAAAIHKTPKKRTPHTKLKSETAAVPSEKKMPKKSTATTRSPRTAKSAPKKTTSRAKAASSAKRAPVKKTPAKIKGLEGLSGEAAHTHTYNSIAHRITESGNRTNEQLRELLHETPRGQAPDAEKLAGIAANYHNLGNFTEALATSSPENIHTLMLKTPNLKPLHHNR